MSALSSLQKLVGELTVGNGSFSARTLRLLSDADGATLQALAQAWPSAPLNRKIELLDALHGMEDDDTLVSFIEVGRQLLADPDADIRLRAIRLLEECRDGRIAGPLGRMLGADASAEVREQAAAALAQFVEMGELDELNEDLLHQTEEILLTASDGDSSGRVRRAALESLGYSSRPEVAKRIQSALEHQNADWCASALCAAGRSSDERWHEAVLARLTDENPQIRVAAVRAAGDLAIAGSVNALLRLLEQEEDDEITGAAIWSLSQIGGTDARVYIQNLMDRAEDDEDVAFLEDVLENLDFTEEMDHFDLFTMDDADTGSSDD